MLAVASLASQGGRVLELSRPEISELADHDNMPDIVEARTNC